MNVLKCFFVTICLVSFSGTASAEIVQADFFLTEGKATAAASCFIQDGEIFLADSKGGILYDDSIRVTSEDELVVRSIYRGQGGSGVSVSQDVAFLGYKFEQYDRMVF